MDIFYTVKELKEALGNLNHDKTSVGFVPTMGALHAGHISLIKNAKQENNIVVCSIFVNPTQFNDKKDLETYPRTLEEDKKQLINSGCDILFVPSVKEMYPDGEQERITIDFGYLDKVMEGEMRLGHFEGVATIVSKLFEMVKPNKAYFGQKDFQQLVIIKQLVKMRHLPVEIVSCPIIRENDGLAMSSRNVKLLPEERKMAVKIAETLFKIKKIRNQHSFSDLKKLAANEISKSALLQLEYFEIVNSKTLMSVESMEEAKEIVACIAVKVGRVRLIDNIILFP